MKLTHPDSDQVIEPKVEHREAYTSQGWIKADEPAATEVDEKPKGK